MKKQFTKTYENDFGDNEKIVVEICLSDDCKNGHNDFSITADIYEQRGSRYCHDSCGCLHDDILKHLRQHRVTGGIAHAFNGSLQQAEQFIALGFKLGFGGALTYSRALKIRELVCALPLEAIVLETDAPDIPPAWLEKSEKNSPKQVVKIAEEIALLRRIPCVQVAEITTKNSMQILPKMAKLFTRPQVLH